LALLLLLIVLGGSAVGGRRIGLALAALSFLIFNWLFLPPYGTLTLDNPLDWLVLVAFLVTSGVAAQLLHRGQQEARRATIRAEELDRLAALGAQSLSAGRAQEALAAVTHVIQQSAGVESAAVYRVVDGDGALELAASTSNSTAPQADGRTSLHTWVAARGCAAAELGDGTVHLQGPRPTPDEVARFDSGDVRALLLPLQARKGTVGVLRVATATGFRLDAEQWRFLEAISYYAALAVERVRLVAEAERAEALREADRLKDALLASVSHDLRTPLTTIKALAHELRYLGDERVEIIEQEADRLNRTVTDLLDLSRLNAGAIRVRPELNTVDDLLGALVQRVEPMLDGRPLLVTLPPGEALLVARFDLTHALRILVNLVDNAFQHAPGNTPIEISAAREGQHVVIRVRDRGPGVAPGERERIFEPFYRPPDTSPGARGAGLGLAIARQLAEAQGGLVEYRPRPGGGSEFALRLPAASLAEMAAAADVR
jgi:two-component system sensor histidine kinase KdpD